VKFWGGLLDDSKTLMRSEIPPPMGRRGAGSLDEEGVGAKFAGEFSIAFARVLARSVHARILGASSRMRNSSKTLSVIGVCD
jgi:hypothetical protein